MIKGALFGWVAGSVIGCLISAIPVIAPLSWLVIPIFSWVGTAIGAYIGKKFDDLEETQFEVKGLQSEVSKLENQVNELKNKNNNTKFLKASLSDNKSIVVNKAESRNDQKKQYDSSNVSNIVNRPRSNSTPENIDRSRSRSPSNK